MNEYPWIYFETKTELNYVRKDRFTLRKLKALIDVLHDKGHSLPTVLSLYENEVAVDRVGWESAT